MANWNHWTLEQTGAGYTAWIDVAGQSQNVFSADVLKEFSQLLTELEQNPDARFVLIRSRKPHSFLRGPTSANSPTCAPPTKPGLCLKRDRNCSLASLPSSLPQLLSFKAFAWGAVSKWPWPVIIASQLRIPPHAWDSLKPNSEFCPAGGGLSVCPGWSG